MKICFVIGTLNYSGAEKIARYLIEALYKKYNCEIGLILISGEGPYPELDYVKQFPIHAKGNKFQQVYSRQKQIRKIVKDGNYDVVVSFGVKFNLDAMEALMMTDKKVILCERNDPYSDPHRKILRLRRSFVYRFAAGYVFQTKRIGLFFGEKIYKKGVVIPNFIENRLDNLYSEKNGKNIVLTARLDDVQKNISMLLRAFSIFSKDNDYKLYIVGDGPDKKKFEKYIENNHLEERVILTGRQNVYEYLKIAQIFVLPSNYEGMPNSLIEALASGIPCIATDCSGGGAAELITDHVNGSLIPVNDEKAMASALEELANNKELREQYSREGYKLNDRLDFNKIIQMWIDYIERVANL